MPFYDRTCTACDYCIIDVLEPVYADNTSCPDCGQPTARAWMSAPPNVIGDECDFVTRNGEKNPRRFRHKSEHRRWLKENHFIVKDEAVSGDKHTKTWTAGGKQWLADAEALAMRNGSASGLVPEQDINLNVTFSEGVATPEMVARYASK